MPVDLIEVESSNIAKIGYEPATQKLYVKFKSGVLWSYAGVPEEKYKEMCETKSKGRYFALSIRTNRKYQAEKVVED